MLSLYNLAEMLWILYLLCFCKVSQGSQTYWPCSGYTSSPFCKNMCWASCNAKKFVSHRWDVTEPAEIRFRQIWISYLTLKNGTRFELYLQWQTDIWSIERRHFQRPWRTSNPTFKVTSVFDAEYVRNGNTNRDLYTPCSGVSFWITLSDVDWLSKIFSDTKHRTLYLRQLSFLFFITWCII